MLRSPESIHSVSWLGYTYSVGCAAGTGSGSCCCCCEPENKWKDITNSKGCGTTGEGMSAHMVVKPVSRVGLKQRRPFRTTLFFLVYFWKIMR